MLSAVIGKGVVAAGDIRVAEINAERCAAVRLAHNVHTTQDPAEAIDGADVALFAVKPQEFEAAAQRVSGRLNADQTVVSIMAGVPIERISRALSHITTELPRRVVICTTIHDRKDRLPVPVDDLNDIR
jgi:pyrroline-5-carboxylate reductase